MVIPKARKLKNGKYFIQLRLNGVSIPVTADTAAEATRQATLIKAGKSLTTSGRHDLPLTEAIDMYISSRSNVLSPATVRGYRTIQRNRFKSVMHKKISLIKNWQMLINTEAKAVSGKTVHNAWGLITAVMTFCGFAIPRVTLPQITGETRRWLTWQELIPFCKAVKGTNVEIPALLALHSLRRSEICALRWEDIDLDAGIIHVRGAVVPDEHNKYARKKETKNTTSRRSVPIMIPQLTAALEAYHGDKLVTVLPSTITHRIKKVCADNDLRIVGCHGLRHSFASVCHHLGIDKLDCMRMGGWSNLATMTKIYTHIDELDLKNHAKKITEFFSDC